MELPAEALALENRHLGPGREPTLAGACEVLLRSWESGDRGRELGLHLMFLSWYMGLEPPYITGLSPDGPLANRLADLFNEVHDHFSPSMVDDAEMLFVVGLMAHLSPWLLGGDHKLWEERSGKYRVMYRRLVPEGIDPQVFAGRGAYGDYFAGQTRVPNGY